MNRRFIAVAVTLSCALASGAAPADESPVEACESRVREEPDALGSWLCFYTVYRRLPDARDDVIRRLDARLAVETDNHFARVALAAIESARGEPRAAQLFREAAAGFAEQDRATEEVRTRINFALYLARTDAAGEADEELQQASAVALRSGDSILRARVLNVRGQLAYQSDDFGLAWRLFREMEAAVFPDGPTSMQARCLSNLGAICTATGRSEEGMHYARRHAELLRRTGDLRGEAQALGNLAQHAALSWGEGELPHAEALELARSALEIAERSGNRQAEAWACHHLGSVLEPEEATAYFDRSLSLAREEGHGRTTGLALRGGALNRLALDPPQLESASILADEAYAVARNAGDLTDVARARIVQAEIAWAAGPRDRAIQASLGALRAIEAVRDLQHDDLVRARFFSRWAFAYPRLAGRLLEPAGVQPDPDTLDAAFRVVERMRARVLLDALDGLRVDRVTGGQAGDLRERRGDVLRRIAGVQRRLVDPATTDEQRRATLTELEALEREEAEVREVQARADREFGALRLTRFPGVDDVRAALAGDEALLSFQLSTWNNINPTLSGGATGGGSWLVVLTRGESRVYPLPDRLELEPAVRALPDLLQRRDGSEVRPAVALHRALFGDALARLPAETRRLVIVPDGPLHRLPFGVLRSAADHPTLAESFELSLAPSATTWVRWRLASAGATGTGTALALADPVPPGTPGDAALERAWSLASGARLGALPHARDEAHTLARHLGRRSRVLVGDEATESRLKRTDLRRFDILHFAVHAVLDDEQPERSALLLAPGGQDEDGLLQLREVVDLDLDGTVVVLSACRSASGELLQGEGATGLARGFFQAGAQAVIGSLWPLRDDEAAALFDDFYRRLARGATVGQAFAGARRDRIRDGAPPASWAGVVLLGDSTAAPVPPRTIPWTGLLSVIAAVGLLAWLVFRRS